jgi:hypothetical protein
MEAESPLEKLREMLANARPIPLTDDVRLDPDALLQVLGEIEATMPGLIEGSESGQDLRKLILSARRVPFTDQVRVNHRKAVRLIEELGRGG